MRVALCSDYFYPKFGGITTHIEHLAKALEENGYEVFIVTKKARFDDKGHGLNVIRVGSFFGTSNTLDVPRLEELRSVIEEIKPDIVHSHHAFSPISLFSLVVGKKLGMRTVLTNHSIQIMYEFEHLWRPSSYILFPYRQYINMADRIIAVSNAAAAFISHFTDKNASVIPNGVDLEAFAPAIKVFNGRNILFVGRFSYRKGVHLLLEVMRRIVDDVTEARLTIAGAGNSGGLLRGIIKALDLQNNVVVEENVSRARLIELYRLADVFLMPSIFGEAFGIVLLEAMASKTPVVAIRQGGIGEVIKDGETGFLVNRYDVRGMAEKTRALLQNPELSERISAKAFEEAHKHDWEKVVKKIEREYLSLF
ncbi:MAG: glycosyltransferase family 4 protein [Candidatus Methanomethyliaceae archaeon]|nr:glycosyltransferase family 4 protein [Candidatus Methanomethyliaceae archaeon]